MINNLPTVYELVTGVAKKQSKAPNGSSKSSKSNSKVSFFFVCAGMWLKSIFVLYALRLAIVVDATPQLICLASLSAIKTDQL